MSAQSPSAQSGPHLQASQGADQLREKFVAIGTYTAQANQQLVYIQAEIEKLCTFVSGQNTDQAEEQQQLQAQIQQLQAQNQQYQQQYQQLQTQNQQYQQQYQQLQQQYQQLQGQSASQGIAEQENAWLRTQLNENKVKEQQTLDENRQLQHSVSELESTLKQVIELHDALDQRVKGYEQAPHAAQRFQNALVQRDAEVAQLKSDLGQLIGEFERIQGLNQGATASEDALKNEISKLRKGQTESKLEVERSKVREKEKEGQQAILLQQILDLNAEKTALGSELETAKTSLLLKEVERDDFLQQIEMLSLRPKIVVTGDLTSDQEIIRPFDEVLDPFEEMEAISALSAPLGESLAELLLRSPELGLAIHPKVSDNPFQRVRTTHKRRLPGVGGVENRMNIGFKPFDPSRGGSRARQSNRNRPSHIGMKSVRTVSFDEIPQTPMSQPQAPPKPPKGRPVIEEALAAAPATKAPEATLEEKIPTETSLKRQPPRGKTSTKAKVPPTKASAKSKAPEKGKAPGKKNKGKSDIQRLRERLLNKKSKSS